MDAGVVRTYAEDLKRMLEEADISESKSFLRSFVKRIEINNNEAVIRYSLPIPHGEDTQSVGVLPMVTPGGEGGTRTPTPCGT